LSSRPDGTIPGIGGRTAHAGIFLVCLSTLIYEVGLTRIFSALMYYHFASMAIAIAFLGMGLGGIVVYIRPGPFRLAAGGRMLALMCLFYGASILLLYVAGMLAARNPAEASGFLTYFHQPYFQPFRQGFTGVGLQGRGLLALLGLSGATMLPFFFAGLVITSLLSGMHQRVGTLYLADMLGAAIGAVTVIFAVSLLGGPGVLLMAGAVGVLGAFAFLWGGTDRKDGSEPGVLVLKGLAVLVLAGTVFLGYAERVYGLVRFDFVGGRYEPGVLDTRWNSFSRVLVYSGRPPGMQERSWGVSPEYRGPRREELNVVINDTGYTTMVKDGTAEQLEYLRHDVTNLPFMLKGPAKTLVIGPGGGRDVLSALVFGSTDVTAVELNPLLKEIVDGRFGEFTGRLYSKPGVDFLVDDGRSYLMRTDELFDVIESARVYEWMGATSGAFSLAENYLYTREAFVDYIGHLKGDGVLSITRFIHEKQAMRLLSLALAAYEDLGVPDPSDRVAIIKERGLATFLFKRGAFTDEELARLKDITAVMGFETVYMPGVVPANEFATFVTYADRKDYLNDYPMNIDPSTDDNPFFNFMVKDGELWRFDPEGVGGFHNLAVMFLRNVFIVMGVMSILVFGFPLLFVRRRGSSAVSGLSGLVMLRYLAYFGAVGLAFMLIEITLLRKFILFLGHPIYSLGVILSAILFSTGVGSLVSSRFRTMRLRYLMVTLAAAAALYGYIPDMVFAGFMASPVIVRAVVTMLVVFPLGFLMGVMFPAGIRSAGANGAEDQIPWFWAVNGVFSVFGTVFALLFSMSFGFTATILAGASLYLAAAMLYVRPVRDKITREVEA